MDWLDALGLPGTAYRNGWATLYYSKNFHETPLDLVLGLMFKITFD